MTLPLAAAAEVMAGIGPLCFRPYFTECKADTTSNTPNQRRVSHFHFYENLVAANLGRHLAL